MVDASITADRLNLVSNSNVSSAEQADAAGSTATADAGVSVAVVDSDAKTYISGNTQLAVLRDLVVQANNTINVQSSVDGAASGAAGAGATLAVSVIQADTQAYVSGSTTLSVTSESVAVSANTTSSANSSATSTAGGADENKTAGSTKTQKVLADPMKDGDADKKAATSDGNINFAGAVALTIVKNNTVAYIDTSGQVLSSGVIDVKANAIESVSTTASGTNTGGAASGVGVAVALNFIDVGSNAYLGGSGLYTAPDAIHVYATLAGESGFNASATSGAGQSDKVGFAGSLALNLVGTKVNALVKSGTSIQVGVSRLYLSSISTTSTNTTADAQQTDAGATGIGASFALGVTDNETIARVESGTAVVGATVLDLISNASHENQTTAKGGAAGGKAITPVVAIAMAFNDTFSSIDALESEPLITIEDVSIKANQANNTASSAEAAAKGSTAVGAALALTVAEDHSDATLSRNLISSAGALMLLSGGTAASSSKSKAGAAGEKEEAATTEKVDDKNNKQLGFGNKRAMAGTGKKSKTETAPKPDAPDKDGTGAGKSVSVAAAIGLNLQDAKSTATIADGVSVEVNGAITVMSQFNADGAAIADGSAVSAAGGTSVGAAVSLNVSNVTNQATAGKSPLSSDGMVIDATMAERNLAITPTSTRTVDIATDTVYVGETLSDLSVGDEVTYRNGGGTNIGGLTAGTKYFVASITEGRIQLAAAKDGAAIDLTSIGTGSAHQFERVGKSTIAFNPAKAIFTLVPQNAIALATGDEVVYRNGGGTNVGGLSNGTKYFAIVRDSGNVDLATTYDNALAGTSIPITSIGTGTAHSISESTLSHSATATSGAGGGKTGIAGSLAINLAKGKTEALLKDETAVTLFDGQDAGDTIGDVSIRAAARTNNRALATPEENASGDSLGVGLSVAVNINDHDVNSQLAAGATIQNAENVSLSADGAHTMLTEAKSGASSAKTAVAGALAIGFSTSDTTTGVSASGDALDISGNLSIVADGSQTQKTTADGQTSGAGVGVGVSFALGIVTDDAIAFLDRSVSTSPDASVGNVTVDSNSTVTTQTDSSAGAKGSEDSSDSNKTADAETDRNTSFAKNMAGMSGSTEVASPKAGDRVTSANTTATDQTKDPGGKSATSSDKTGSDATSDTKGGSVKLAAAIGASVLTPAVTARIANGVSIQSNGIVLVRALSDGDATTLASGLAVADNATGIGAAVTVNVSSIDTTATVGDGNFTVSALKIEAGTPSNESSDYKVRSLAGGKTQGGGTAIAGSVGVNVISNDVSATIADNATITTSGGNVELASRNDIGIQTLVGGAAQSKKASSAPVSTGNSFGAAIGVNVVNNSSVALVGENAVIKAATQTVAVDAHSAVSALPIEFPDFPIDQLKELITELEKTIVPNVTMAVAGAGDSSGGNGIAGSVAVSVINVTTTAELRSGANVEAKDVSITADDSLGITNFVGALAKGLSKGGFGAGLDVLVTHLDTTASIAAAKIESNPTTVIVSGNVVVQATSDEDIFTLSANVGIGASAGVAGAAVVVVQDTNTRAFIGDDPNVTPALAGFASVLAAGSIHVAADSSTSIDAAAGAVAGAKGSADTGGSGGKSVGASVAVIVDTDHTEAFIGAGSRLTAFGDASIAPVKARNGKYDASGNQGTEDVRGLVVTATSYDDILSVGIGAAAAAGNQGAAVGIGGSVTVNILTGDTLARLDSGASVNEFNLAPGAAQTVLLRASDKTVAHSDAGGVALTLGTGNSSASAAFGAAVAVGILTNNTRTVADNARVNAQGAFVMDSDSLTDIDSLSIGVAGAATGGKGGGLTLSGAGSGTGNTVDNTVESLLLNGSLVIAGGSLSVTANDNSVINSAAGAGALSAAFGSKSKAAAVGVAVAVNDIKNNVRAKAVNSTLSAGSTVNLTADAAPKMKATTVGGAIAAGADGGTGGSLAGAGAAGINTIGGTIEASVQGSTNSSVAGGTGINISAMDRSAITSNVVGASVAASGTGGSSGALAIGVSIARNEISNVVNAFADGLSLQTGAGDIRIAVNEAAAVSATSVAASLSIAGAGSNAVALSGGGAEAINSIVTKSNAYAKDSSFLSRNNLAITSDNTASIEAKILAASASVGGGGSNAGAASIGASRARNLIGFKLDGTESAAESQAYILNSTVEAAQDVLVRSLSNQKIDVLVGAASVAVSGAGSNALGLSGAGVEASNRVRIFVSAYIDDDGPFGVSANSVTVNAQDNSGISSKAGAASLAIAGAGTVGAAVSVGVALARNEVNNEVQAFIKNADQLTTKTGAVDVTAFSNSKKLFNLATSGAQLVTVAELDDAAEQAQDDSTTPADEKAVDATGDAAILAKLKAQFTAQGNALSDRLKLTALNSGKSWTLVDETNSTSYVIQLAANNALEVSKTTIEALAIAASIAAGFGGTGGVAISGAGANATNVILTDTNAFIENSNVTSNGAVNLDAASSSSVVAIIVAASAAVAGAGAGGVGASIGAALAKNFIGFTESGTSDPAEIQAYVKNSSINAVGALTADAIGNQAIGAVVFAGSVAIAASGSGAVGLGGSGVSAINKIGASIKAYLDGDGAIGIVAPSISLNAEDMSTIKAIAGAVTLAAAFAGDVGVAFSITVTLAKNEINNQVEASIKKANDQVRSTVGGVKAKATESAKISAISAAASASAAIAGSWVCRSAVQVPARRMSFKEAFKRS